MLGAGMKRPEVLYHRVIDRAARPGLPGGSSVIAAGGSAGCRSAGPPQRRRRRPPGSRPGPSAAASRSHSARLKAAASSATCSAPPAGIGGSGGSGSEGSRGVRATASRPSQRGRRGQDDRRQKHPSLVLGTAQRPQYVLEHVISHSKQHRNIRGLRETICQLSSHEVITYRHGHGPGRSPVQHV